MSVGAMFMETAGVAARVWAAIGISVVAGTVGVGGGLGAAVLVTRRDRARGWRR